MRRGLSRFIYILDFSCTVQCALDWLGWGQGTTQVQSTIRRGMCQFFSQDKHELKLSALFPQYISSFECNALWTGFILFRRAYRK